MRGALCFFSSFCSSSIANTSSSKSLAPSSSSESGGGGSGGGGGGFGFKAFGGFDDAVVLGEAVSVGHPFTFSLMVERDGGGGGGRGGGGVSAISCRIIASMSSSAS